MNNIFSRFALRSLSRNRIRTLVTIAGITLSCALLTAVLTSVVSMSTMLARRTAHQEGAWQVEALDASAKQYEYATSSKDIAQLGALAELGAVQMSEKDAELYGDFFFVKTWPAFDEVTTSDDTAPLVSTPQIVDGRVPEKDGEIVLPEIFKNSELSSSGIEATGPLTVGSTVTLHQGTRTISDNETGKTMVAGSSDSAFVDESINTQHFEENVGARTYTVVGFCDVTSWGPCRALAGTFAYVYPNPALIEQALEDDISGTSVDLIMALANPQRAINVVDELNELGGDTYMEHVGGATTHDNLLRWQGVVTSDSTIYDTLTVVAFVLATVIVIASISLIYNAFAISVSERTRQFGLLASLGASRRQLCSCVLTEALSLGVIGIPLGILIGLAGCYVVFAITGEGLATLVYGTGADAATVVVNPLVLVLAIVLSLITLLISAWIPSRRAARVSAIDAIRQVQDVHMSRRERKRISRGTKSFYRLSTPSFMARRNLKRASSKSRVTVAALAVSITLLLITGSVTSMFNDMSNFSIKDKEGLDVTVDFSYSSPDDGAEAGSAMTSYIERDLASIDAKAAQLDGVAGHSYSVSALTDAFIPEQMLKSDADDNGMFTSRVNGHGATSLAEISFVDTATWEAYIEDLGLDRDAFCDPANPQAVLFNNYGMYVEGKLVWDKPFDKTGIIDSYVFKEDEAHTATSVCLDHQGTLQVSCFTEDGNTEDLPLDDLVADHTRITVGALADRLPAGVGETSQMTLVMPVTAIPAITACTGVSGDLNVDTDGDTTAATSVEDELESMLETNTDARDHFIFNNAVSAQQQRLMQDAVNIFIYCFSGITGLIAIANVFNTVSNSFMLRRREFAVLKSIGMDTRSFNKMIVRECASYAIRGLAIGVVLALAVNMGLSYAMSFSYEGYRVSIPPIHIAICVAATLAVIVASVTFALHKNKSSNVVETLREEAV